MKLIPYMINVDYNHQGSLLDDKTLEVRRINIGRKLKYDSANHYWFTQNHYRGNKEEKKSAYNEFYQIGFKLVDYSSENISVKFMSDTGSPHLLLAYNDEHDVWFQKTVFKKKPSDKPLEYYPFSPRTRDYQRGLNHAGEIEVGVFCNQDLVLSERILFLPSSISVYQYNVMITDLYRMREELVKSEKIDIEVSLRKEKTIEKLEQLVKEIQGPINFINKYPAEELKVEKKFLREKSISRFHPDIEMQKILSPGKAKFKAMYKRKDYSITENIIVKQELEKLIEYSTKLFAQKDVVESDKRQIHHEGKAVVRKSSKRIRETVNQKGIENLDSATINAMLKVINKEIEQKNREVSERKPVLLDMISRNSRRRHFNLDNGIAIKLNLKVNAKFYQKGFKSLENPLSVSIGSGKIPDDNRPAILFKGYQYYRGDGVWDEPSEVKSIFCDILNSSITNKEQLLLLKSLSDIVATQEILEEETEVTIKGFISRTMDISNTGKKEDIIGKSNRNPLYKDYVFNFKKIHSILIQGVEYKLNTSEAAMAEELCELLLLHDEKVQKLYEKIEQLELEKQYVFKLRQLIKQKTSIDRNAERYIHLANKISELINLPVFKGIDTKVNERLIPTQLFLHDPYYKKIWKLIKNIDDIIGASLIPGSNNKKIGIKKVNEIYEIWSLIKMVSILSNQMGWKISNKETLIRCLDSFLQLKKELRGFNISLEQSNFFLEISYEPKVLFEGERYNKLPDYRFIFKKKAMWGKQTLGVVYLDAKYRNYKDRDDAGTGEQEWREDIIDIAINNYGSKPHKDYPNIKTIASFILHPDIELGMEKETKGENYFAYYNRKLFPGKLDQQNVEEVHKFGSIYLLPTSTHSFVNWFKMLMEYRMKNHEVCWSCGNHHRVTRETKYTGRGYPKYHYKCQNKNCEEYWIKNHCSQKGHKLVKHINNYHRQPSEEYEWYVVCPTCGDGFNKEQKERSERTSPSYSKGKHNYIK